MLLKSILNISRIKHNIVLLAVTCFFFVTQSIKSQNIICDLNVAVQNQVDSIYEINDEKTYYIFFGIFPLKITQTLYLPNTISDSLVLNLQNSSFLNQILSDIIFHNLVIKYEKFDRTQSGLLQYDFDGNKIVIRELEPQMKKIIISYEYQSDFPTKNAGEHTLFFMQPQIYAWHSWFFTCKEMKLNNITFSVPENQAYFFATNTVKNQNKEFVVNANKIKDFDISFYLLKKTYYEKIDIKNGNVTAILLFNKGLQIDTVSSVINDTARQFARVLPGKDTITNSLLDKQNYIYNALDKIIDFFEFKDTMSLYIADGHLYFEDGNSKKYAWGMGTECSDKSFFLMVDTSFWNTKNLTHEMIHAFNKYLPERDDKSYFLFNESMVEYLAVCLEYENLQKRDSVFTGAVEYYNKSDSNLLYDRNSIFNITDNRTAVNEGMGGTSPVIYFKTPYVIHQFAKQIGEDRFFSILKSFYSNVRKKRELSFSDFEQTFKQNGITEQQWNDFMKDL